MKAIKDNKVYTVDETTKGAYLAQGFNITDDEGNVIERSPSSTVSYEAYAKVVAENKALKAENQKLKSENEKQGFTHESEEAVEDKPAQKKGKAKNVS